jgi:hypothetical protein
MGDTGWLRTGSQTVPTGANGATWYRRSYMISPNNRGADSWMSQDPDRSSETAPIIFNWAIPTSLVIPGNAVVVGIEFRVYAYQYQHVFTDPDYDVSYFNIQLGDATLTDGNVAPPAPQIYRIFDFDTIEENDPVAPLTLTLFGNPTELFDLPPGTRVVDFFNQIASNTAAGPRNGSITVGMDSHELIHRETAIYLSYAQVKVHYDVPATEVDLAADPEIAVSSTGDLEMIRKLAALVAVDVIIEEAQLGGISTMESAPEVEVGLPADITSGTGFIDSTALPTVVFTIPDVDLALLRFSDMEAVPRVFVDMLAIPPGNRRNIASNPSVSITLQHGIKNIVDISVNEDQAITVVSMDDPGLAADGTVRAEPFVVISVTANLMGDINLADDCGEAELTTVVSLIADLGYARGLYSNPNIYVTLDGDGLANGAALEFAPLVSVTIPFANLGSKFAKPAPDHRTVFKCPVDRTIRITRKDKTIL